MQNAAPKLSPHFYQREILTKDLCDEMFPLLRAHYEEIAHFKDIPLSPDVDRYLKIEENGGLRLYTARSPSGELLGYSVYFIHHNLHYSSSLQALQDVLYISPRARGKGMRLIAWCDEQLRGEGVQAVYHHVKTKHNFGPMLERIGYELVDLIYTRRL